MQAPSYVDWVDALEKAAPVKVSTLSDAFRVDRTERQTAHRGALRARSQRKTVARRSARPPSMVHGDDAVVSRYGRVDALARKDDNLNAIITIRVTRFRSTSRPRETSCRARFGSSSIRSRIEITSINTPRPTRARPVLWWPRSSVKNRRSTRGCVRVRMHAASCRLFPRPENSSRGKSAGKLCRLATSTTRRSTSATGRAT